MAQGRHNTYSLHQLRSPIFGESKRIPRNWAIFPPPLYLSVIPFRFGLRWQRRKKKKRKKKLWLSPSPGKWREEVWGDYPGWGLTKELGFAEEEEGSGENAVSTAKQGHSNTIERAINFLREMKGCATVVKRKYWEISFSPPDQLLSVSFDQDTLPPFYGILYLPRPHLLFPPSALLSRYIPPSLRLSVCLLRGLSSSGG